MLGCESEEIDSIYTINTILSLEEKEVFTTLDIMLFDLFNANAEFIKAGATESYLKRDNEVISLSAQALPIGIIENIDLSKETIKLQNNDYIYMMSDGFLEAFMAVSYTHLHVESKSYLLTNHLYIKAFLPLFYIYFHL